MTEPASGGRVWQPHGSFYAQIARLKAEIEAGRKKQRKLFRLWQKIAVAIYASLSGVILTSVITLSIIGFPTSTPEGMTLGSDSTLDPTVIGLFLVGFPLFFLFILSVGWFGVVLGRRRVDWVFPIAFILAAVTGVSLFFGATVFNDRMEDLNSWIRSELSITTDTRFHEEGQAVNAPNISTWKDGEIRKLVDFNDEVIPVVVHRSGNTITSLERVDGSE